MKLAAFAITFSFGVTGCSESLNSTSQTTSCPATTAFAVSACICENFADVGNLIVGKSVEKDLATMAVMGTSKVINNFQVRGDYHPHGGLEAIGNLEITGKLSTVASIQDFGNLDVDGDVQVGGDLSGIGRLAVG